MSLTLFFDASLGQRVPRALRLAGTPDIGYEYLHEWYRRLEVDPHAIEDPRWLSLVGERGWLALTQDLRILMNRDERHALVRANAGVVIIEPGDALNHELLEFIVCQSNWLRRVHADTPRPFAYRVSLRDDLPVEPVQLL